MSRLRYKYTYVSRLIERGAVQNISTDIHSTSKLPLLHLAVWNADERLVIYLLEKKADINVSHLKKGTPLHIAVAMGNLEIVKILVQFGADIHRQLLVYPWHTPLHRAVAENNTKIVEFFLNNGGNINIMLDHRAKYYCRKTLLEIAIIRCREEMVKLLLEYNAHLDISARINIEYLDSAAYKENLAIAKLLIEYGADINGGKRADGDTPFPPLLAAASRLNLDVLELLLSNDTIQVNIVSSIKYTALHHAVLYMGDVNIIQRLLDAGVDINLENDKGKTALELVTRHKQRAKCLLMKHIVKLWVADAYVSQKNLEAVVGAYDKLRNKCIKEIEMMKETFISTSSLTFYDVLHQSRHSLASRLRCVSDETVFNFDIEKIFSQYAGMINYRLKKALSRKKILLDTSKVIYQIFYEVQIPCTITREIIGFLTHEDLQKFIPQ